MIASDTVSGDLWRDLSTEGLVLRSPVGDY